MEKFNSKTHKDHSKTLPFSYFSSDIYLDFATFTFKRNGEDLIVWQDTIFPHDLPSIFLPRNKENWTNCSVALATKNDIEKVNKEKIKILITKPMGAEYFYRTGDFTQPQGVLKSKLNRFKNNYKFKLKGKYNKEKILKFYNFWKKQRKHESATFDESEEFFYFCLNNLNRYGIKQVYAEVDGELAGFAWGVKHRGNWIGLNLKVNYKYKGLSRFLYSERAKLFSNTKEFTLGTGAHDAGIDSYKKELGPSREEDYFYLLTLNN